MKAFGFGAIAIAACAAVSQAAVLNIDPGTFGSYRPDNSQVRAGTFSLRPQAGSFIWQDRNGVQNEDLSARPDGVYEIVARDANVVIGSFTNTGGTPSAPTGSVTLAGNNLNFVNHHIDVTGAPGWNYNDHLWNLSFSETNVTQYVMPAGNNWGGWYGRIGDGNDFSINVANDGTVAVVSDVQNIGIYGGLGQLNFPSVAVPVLYIPPSTIPPGANFAQLDHATGQLGFGPGSTLLQLYSGNYSFITGLPDNPNPPFNDAWTPMLVSRNVVLPPIFTTAPRYNFNYHSFSNGQDYLFSFAVVPEPGTAGLLFGAIGLSCLRRRKR